MITKQEIEKLKIVSYPDPVLRKKCQPIEEFGEELQLLTEKMWQMMHDGRGVGLAGPQVGLALRIFVWNPTGDPEDNHVSINPKLENLEKLEEMEEGCLSLCGVNVQVKRALTAELEAQTPDGSVYRMRGEGLPARIWQHEYDHLEGRMIIDYMSSAEEIANRRSLKELTEKFSRKRKSHRKTSRR